MKTTLLRRSLVTLAIFSVTLGATLGQAAATVFAGHSRATVDLTVWTAFTAQPDLVHWREFNAAFEKLHPTLHVNFLGAAQEPKVLTAIAGGRPPDVFANWDSGYLGSWAQKGGLTDLTPYVRSAGLAKTLDPGYFQLGTVQGRVWGVPYLGDAYMLAYSKPAFAQAGIMAPPRTWEELLADAAKLTIRSGNRITRLGFRPVINGCCARLLPFLNFQMGGTLYNPATHQLTLASSANQAALQWEIDYYKTYGLSSMDRFLSGIASFTYSPQDPFLLSQLGMEIVGEWRPFGWDHWGKRIAATIALAPLPYPAKHPEMAHFNYATAASASIPKGAKHVAEAWAYLQFLASRQGQLILANGVDNLPTRRDLLADPALLTTGRLAQFARYRATATVVGIWPPTPATTELMTTLSQEEDLAIHGKQTAAQALANVQKRVQPSITSALTPKH